jgi:glycosyltransferase involved in cell wall biosynthesis
MSPSNLAVDVPASVTPAAPPSSVEKLDTADFAMASLDRIASVLATANERDERTHMSPKLSIVIPVYNECGTIVQVIESVRRLAIDKQIIVVDDGSTDGTRDVLASLQDMPNVEVFFHSVNQGKGAALQTGFRLAEGDIVIVQDADLEYNPEDILKVIEPIERGETSIAFGSRYLQANHQNSSIIHRLGNWGLTTFSNLMNGQKLTDMETCYKAFRREVLEEINVEQRRFGFEPEITAKIARRGLAIVEVPIRYNARSWVEGKKIGIRDLLNAIYCIVRYRFFR